MGTLRLALVLLAAAASLACAPSERPGPQPPPEEPPPAEPGVSAPSRLTYPVSRAVLALGIAIPPSTPSHEGGPVTSFAVAPALPAGLGLAPETGTLSGTPDALAPLATYVVTASNAAGSATCGLALAVLPAGEVWISPEQAGVETQGELFLAAGVAGTDAPVRWSASDGQIDGAGLLTAPRLPGTLTVTATSPSDAARTASAEVIVSPRTNPNVEVTVSQPAGDVTAQGTLVVEGRVTSRYLLADVEADLDGAPLALELPGGGAFRAEVDLRAAPEGVRWLRVAARDWPGSTTEVFRRVTVLRP